MNYKLRNKFDCNQGAIRAVRYNVDGNYCLACGADRKVKLINPETGLMIKAYTAHGDEVSDAAGSCDSSFILSGSKDKSIIYWDVMTGLPVRRIRNHVGGITCVSFNDDSSVALSGSRDNSIQCFDIRSRSLEPIQIMKEAKDCVTDLIVTENKIISSSLDGCIRYYDIRAGELTSEKVGVPIVSMAITSDSQCILASCQDESIRLIDLEGGDILTEYKEHRGPREYKIECGVLKGDGYVISGSNNGEVIIYDFLEATVVKRLQIGSGNIISSMCVHPSDDQILFANGREVQVWAINDSDEN